MRRNYLLEFRHDLRILLTGQINIHINMRKTSSRMVIMKKRNDARRKIYNDGKVNRKREKTITQKSDGKGSNRTLSTCQ